MQVVGSDIGEMLQFGVERSLSAARRSVCRSPTSPTIFANDRNGWWQNPTAHGPVVFGRFFLADLQLARLDDLLVIREITGSQIRGIRRDRFTDEVNRSVPMRRACAGLLIRTAVASLM
jgi:hypothetical protein